MRIRSIRPEFWRSEDIAALDWRARLLFIGLWSYVDDNGVGRDADKVIAADLFALEEDPLEALATVSRGLASLADAGLITRYSVAGRNYLHITTWTTHQKIDRPGTARYPLPTSSDAVSRESVATPSRAPIEPSPPGEGEKGRRGEGEKTSAPADAGSARDVIAAWIDHRRSTPPKRVLGQVSRLVKELLADPGIERVDIEEGLIALDAKRLAPSVLPSLVGYARDHRTGTAAAPRNATTDTIDALLAFADEQDRLDAQTITATQEP